MLASVNSAVLDGVGAEIVNVEVHMSKGLPAYSVVGLPDAAGRESKERVRSALLSSGFEFPLRRITVNLAPASVRKHGPGLELAIALGLLCASGEIEADQLAGTAAVGELGLDGSIRPVPGALALVDSLARRGVERVVVPAQNAIEAALVSGVAVVAARSLAELRSCLRGESAWPELADPVGVAERAVDPSPESGDMADVRGLTTARQALAVAAAGRHHLLLVGPPGAGKTMLVRRYPTIAPPLCADEAMEVSRIRSAGGVRVDRLATDRPFRAPHHSASTAALVGGGSSTPRPGELTRAHRGALFLDELAEFSPRVLDALRQPLEERLVRIARQAGCVEFPADVVLLACANPCGCGQDVDACRCSDAQLTRHRRRVSGPLLDRFDLRVRVAAPSPQSRPGPTSDEVRATVLAAMERQRHRYSARPWRVNAHVPATALGDDIPLHGDAAHAWREAGETLGLSGRGAARVRRVARTLADLADRPEITSDHVELAASLREEVL